MMVKRAAFGAEGFVLNHYDRAAVESYLKNVGDRLMQALRRATARTPSSATAWKSTRATGPATCSENSRSGAATT